jgi:hypothetical protein
MFFDALLTEDKSTSIASILTSGNDFANDILAQPSPHSTSRTYPLEA